MARGIPVRLPANLRLPVEEGRILIISPFARDVTNVTNETAIIRNRMMIEIADEVIIGYVDPTGRLCQILPDTNKNITYL